MDIKDSSTWLEYFERNRLDRPEPDWARPTPFPPPVAARLARSLAHFQLGESCEGTTLLTGVRRSWPDDPDYVAAMALFVAEEREHSRLLKHLVIRFGGTLVTKHWTDRCFTLARHALGLGFEIQAVMVAELVGGAYFRLLRSTGDSVLREVCELMVRDEDQHRRFHVDRVVIAQCRWSSPRRALWAAQFKLMFRAALLAAWFDHRCALRAVGISRRLFFAEARADARGWLLRRRELARAPRVAAPSLWSGGRRLGSRGSPLVTARRGRGRSPRAGTDAWLTPFSPVAGTGVPATIPDATETPGNRASTFGSRAERNREQRQ